MLKKPHLNKHSLVLFGPQIGLYQVLLLLARVDLGAMAMKEFSTLHKAPASLEPSDCFVSYSGHSLGWVFAKMQLVYSTALGDWATECDAVDGYFTLYYTADSFIYFCVCVCVCVCVWLSDDWLKYTNFGRKLWKEKSFFIYNIITLTINQ